jgi:hypothetical protein
MDPATLAAAALTVLAPYLAKAGETMAGKIGEALPENASKLWAAITGKFKGKPAAEEAVKDLAQAPADGDNQAAFRKELRKALLDDPEFQSALATLLAQAQQESIRDSAVAKNGGIAINVKGDVQGGIAIGNDNVAGGSTKKK